MRTFADAMLKENSRNEGEEEAREGKTRIREKEQLDVTAVTC